MSLIILKNTDSQPPNKFGNDFVNTITIKKNSEVALHSISFNRLDGYAVNDFCFYIYKLQIWIFFFFHAELIPSSNN